MKLTKLLILLLLLSLKGVSQTPITSSITITQSWVDDAINNTRPWTISGSNITVTFTGNLELTTADQYFIITGTNVTIDGAGKTATISGVTDYPGLVDASNTDATSLIKNIGVVTQSSSTLSDFKGWISQNLNKANISNCYSTGAISGLNAGGIVGYINSGNISNCFSTGNISGENAGGISTRNEDQASITNCYSSGEISGNYAAGITGLVNNGSITNCYSSGEISGNYASGIAGLNIGSIIDCRTSGTLTNITALGIADNVDEDEGTEGTISNSTNITPTIANEWDNTIANQALTGLGSIWNTSNTPYTLMSFLLSELTLTSPSGPLTSNCAGVPSTSTTFGVAGSGLTTPVIITAPSNFEVSISSDGSYSSSLTLPQASTVSQTVYIRLSSAATTNGANGIITANSSSLTPATTTVSSTTVAAPIFSVTGPFTICSEGTYAVSLTVANSYNGWTASSNAITVNSAGYVTAGTITGTYSVSYSDACAQTTSATVTVASTSTLPTITDGLASYKFNNNPQGPLGSGNVIYMGYNGFNYSSTIRPTNTGFYRANNVTGSDAGSPTQFYIFRCTTCGTVSEYAKRPQGTLTGNTISQGGTGQLTYTSSNGGGPFTIVYQATGASPVTVNNISSTVAFNVLTPTITTSYKLISVTDESTNASTDFSGIAASVTVNIPHYVGESYGGGIVFYITDGGAHGLIAATSDQSAGIQWNNGLSITTGATGTAMGTGLSNTNTIITSQGATATSYAAGLAKAYFVGVYTDWYLPSQDELNLLYLNRDAIGGFATNSYWSSTEFSRFLARIQNFSTGGQSNAGKAAAYYVRAIRSF